MNRLRHQLHKQVHIIDLPDTRVDLQEKITVAKIAQEQTAIAIANKIFIVTKLEVEIFCRGKMDGAARVDIISSRFLKIFIETYAGHGIEVNDALLHKLRTAFLVVGDVSGETNAFCYKAAQGKTF